MELASARLLLSQSHKMVFDAGKLNPVTYVFAGGSITVYASNREYASLLLYLANVCSIEDAGSQLHTTAKTKHKTLGSLTNINLP